MKLAVGKKVHYDSGPNMTPLVDVVMVILIFLMLAGSFIGSERMLASNLPITERGGGGEAPPPGFVPDEPLMIIVDSPTPDRFVARVGTATTSEGTALSAMLVQQRDALARTGKPAEQVQVIISPSKGVKWKFLIEVYEAAMRAKFGKIAFAPSR